MVSIHIANNKLSSPDGVCRPVESLDIYLMPVGVCPFTLMAEPFR
jgi:hypothetical protein